MRAEEENGVSFRAKVENVGKVTKPCVTQATRAEWGQTPARRLSAVWKSPVEPLQWLRSTRDKSQQ